MLREVLPGAEGKLGPVFWGTPAGPPPQYRQSTARNKVRKLAQMDAQTRADVAKLHGVADGFVPPCDTDGTGTLKCEACPNGCQVYSLSPKADGLANERAYCAAPLFSRPQHGCAQPLTQGVACRPDPALRAAGGRRALPRALRHALGLRPHGHRSGAEELVRRDGKCSSSLLRLLLLSRSLKRRCCRRRPSRMTTQTSTFASPDMLCVLSWHEAMMACRRGQAGVLPDGRGIFLLSNAAPAHVRDPLTVSLAAQLALRLLPQSLTKGHTDRPLQGRLRLLRVQDRADMHRPRRRGDDMQNAKPPEPQRRPKLSPGSQRGGARAGCDAGPLRCGDEQQGGRGGDEGAMGLAPGRAGMMPVKPSGMCAQ